MNDKRESNPLYQMAVNGKLPMQGKYLRDFLLDICDEHEPAGKFDVYCVTFGGNEYDIILDNDRVFAIVLPQGYMLDIEMSEGFIQHMFEKKRKAYNWDNIYPIAHPQNYDVNSYLINEQAILWAMMDKDVYTNIKSGVTISAIKYLYNLMKEKGVDISMTECRDAIYFTQLLFDYA